MDAAAIFRRFMRLDFFIGPIKLHEIDVLINLDLILILLLFRLDTTWQTGYALAMISKLYRLWKILNARQKRNFFVLQILLVGTSLFELISVASIAPFMAAVADPSAIHSNGILEFLHQLMGAPDDRLFLYYLGFSVIGVIFVGNLFSLATIYGYSRYGFNLGASLSEKLFEYYLFKDVLFHSQNNSNKLMANIQNEVRRICELIVQQFLVWNSKVFSILFLGLGLMYMNLKVTLIVTLVLGCFYVVVFAIVKKGLSRAGSDMGTSYAKRNQSLNESFGALKDMKLQSKENFFVGDFETYNRQHFTAMIKSQFLSMAPRPIMEIIAFCGFISIILFLLGEYDKFSDTLPLIAFYAMAGFKLLPALQQSFYATAIIKGHISAFDLLEEDLKSAQAFVAPSSNCSPISFQKNVTLENVSFTYPGRSKPVLDQVSIEIPKNKTVAFVGFSGSGKTTCADIVLGLLKHSSGRLLVDGVVIDDTNLRNWQANLSYVPQTVFMMDNSLRRNIAFGVHDEDIDVSRVEKVSKMASLDKFIQTLPDGYETRIGERGVQLSGGQRQRIGIARALYSETPVIVFDEATSALDTITEDEIIQSIQELSGHKTMIVIAHRLSTVKEADLIYLFKDGHVVGRGHYQELISGNSYFQELAKKG